jgi:hypothetical protein
MAIEKTILRILRPSAFSDSLGQKRKWPGLRGTSVSPSGADIISLPRHVNLVPRVDIREMKEFANWQDGRPP